MTTSPVSAKTTRPLKIALLAPLVTPISPPFLGGAQAMLNDLAVGLARRGHEVTMFAATGSRLEGDEAERVRLAEVPVRPGELTPAVFDKLGRSGEPEAALYRQGELFLQIFLQLNRTNSPFDIAHAHAFDWPAFALAPLSQVPTVHTVHLPSVDPRINALLQTVYRETSRSGAVTVSQACAQTYAGDFPFDRVIYNGINTAEIPFGGSGEGFLLFAGRMAPEKGADLAIEIARQAGKRLVMAGGIYDQGFYEGKIAPALAASFQIEYRGALQRAELYRLMSRADGVLFPSRWEEPFGLVLAEAQAAGAPVISWRRGAAPEIVEEGRTGFLLDYEDVAGAAAAVARLNEIDRAACRRQIETKFSQEKMLEEYEAYYYEVLNS